VLQRASSTSRLREFLRPVSVVCIRLTLPSISRLFDKMNTFQWTQSIEEGTLSLREAAEYRTDMDLYHVIRLQRIIENIDKISTPSGVDNDAQSAYLRVRSELEEFRSYLCSDVSDSRKSTHLPGSTLSAKHVSRPSLYAVSYCEAVPLSSCIFRAKSATVAVSQPQHLV
jgi:hypothetical protein